jgi:predicted RNase H-like HicB family nuclease
MKKQFDTVELERDSDGYWVARVVGAAGCHTQGRSIAQAMNRIREAAEVCEIALSAEPKRVFLLGNQLDAALKQTRVSRTEAQRAEREAAAATLKIAKTLERKGFSRRDIGAVLGLSFQRAQQLVG